jgi:hypothetical protein
MTSCSTAGDRPRLAGDLTDLSGVQRVELADTSEVDV